MSTVSTSTVRSVICAAALCLTAALPGFAANRTLLVFPVDKPDTVDQSVADTVSSALRSRVAASGGYDAMTFYAKAPLVARALASGGITQAQMAGPFTADTAAAISRAVGADYALIGSVEDASADEAAKKANVTISVQLVSASDGKSLKTAGASGEGASPTLATDALYRLAADNAAAKASAQVFGAIAPAPGVTGVTPGKTTGGTPPSGIATPKVAKKSKKNNSGLLIGGLVLIGVIAASSHHGGGSGNGGSGGPPPFPF